MVEVDISSYPKPGLPVNMLDVAGKLGGLKQQQQQIQSGAIAIDKQKLDLMNNHFQIMQNELGTLANDPKATKEEVLQRMHRIGDTFNMPAPVRAQMEAEFSDVPGNKALGKDGEGNPLLARRLDLIMKRAFDTNQRINSQYGAPGSSDNGQTVTPTRQGLRGPPIANGLPIQKQLPINQPQLGPNNQPVLTGPQPPQLPVGATAAPGGLPGQYKLPVAPAPFNERFTGGPAGPATGLPPGVAEAQQTAAIASGEQLATMRRQASSFQRDIFPLAQAIPELEKLGTKGTGPGTDTINNIKSFVLSNIPGVKESDFSGSVKDFDKAKKYMTDYVNQTGNSGTNDKLAAAFAGNPSVHISNAAAVDVAKSAMALRKMQQAIYLDTESNNLPAHEVSRHVAKLTNEIDPRAFGTENMSAKAKKVLLEQLNKNPVEKERFERSAKLAAKYNLLGQ